MGREPGQTHRPTPTLSSEDVRAYLRNHPDFLVQNADLVHHLTPPSIDRGRGVVDLQAFMVERLRSELRTLKDQQRELIGTSRANLNSQNRIHAAVLFLLDAQSFEQLIQTITTDLAVLLDLDVACLVIESNGTDMPHVHRSGVRVVEAGAIDGRLGRADVVLNGDIEGDPEIYGPGAGLVRSEALIRIQVSSETPDGMLAFGSREPDTFHGGQGTELVGFLARVIERVIRGWLELPA
ncbi:DUF484 family protein [Azospirillum picis]|uniref:Uncharacterized protein YigA (DUF484 family) n=1 Tax=Azospirillum picis TaxID=488438 RepID=A0ABU0MPD7_9PROT|nr:DUF484 family protein [Azospirillum picis]MBP2301500.1 uncharacterized protein YigA (DUF484 family) [Azospirillum picis]MDQ0535332.1 uncharacterized protein YigA (DUF484 family) [Azospirillum picis]